MKSRLALSALFILIAAMAVASNGTGLLQKLTVGWASSAERISEPVALPLLDGSSTAGNQRHGAVGAISPDAKIIRFPFPDATHCPHARRVQRFVLSLIAPDHQGE